VYRREEDPEIAERRAQDQENAERSGLVASASADQDEDVPQTVSLKERVALLQKRQAEQAARHDVSAKEKPKRPPKKRIESHEQADTTEERNDVQAVEPVPRESFESTGEPSETARPPKVPKPSEHAPRRNIVSDGNDADQSAAGETTEDAEGTSGSAGDEDETPEAHPAQVAAVSQRHGDEVEEESTEEEEEELDEEARHQMALRERMAKLSGGMGMGAMFGPPGGMPMMGMAGGPKKKKAPEPKAVEEEPTPMARAPRIPGIAMPGLNRTMSMESSASTEVQSGDDAKPQVAPRSAPAPPRGIYNPSFNSKARTDVPVGIFHVSSRSQSKAAFSPRSRKYRSERYAMNWVLRSSHVIHILHSIRKLIMNRESYTTGVNYYRSKASFSAN
jgi:hypothetical protein